MAADDLIDMFGIYQREIGRTARTIQTYRDALSACDRALPYGIDSTTTTELRQWLGRPEICNSTRKTYRAALRAFNAWALGEGHIDYDPAADLPRYRVEPGLPRVATDEQVRQVLTRADQPYRLWAVLACYAGLRCIEVHRLHREHITEQNIHVHRGKGDKARIIPTHPVIWAAIRDLPAGRIVDTEHEHQISLRFLMHCQALGLAGVSMHRLRGWMATTSYQATKDARALQSLLGHASLGTTQVYVGVGEEARRALISSLPPVVGGGIGAPGLVAPSDVRTPLPGVVSDLLGGDPNGR